MRISTRILIVCGLRHMICYISGPHGVINHLVNDYCIMGKRIAITIRGIVIAAAWKQNGEISAVDIAGYDENRYRVANDHFGIQLQGLIKKRIVVDGFVETENNKSVLYIRHFQIDTSDTMKALKPQDGWLTDLPPIGYGHQLP
jgi:hypothetical protein